jgi:hypothetical protein
MSSMQQIPGFGIGTCPVCQAAIASTRLFVPYGRRKRIHCTRCGSTLLVQVEVALVATCCAVAAVSLWAALVYLGGSTAVKAGLICPLIIAAAIAFPPNHLRTIGPKGRYCGNCGYNLRGRGEREACPECGASSACSGTAGAIRTHARRLTCLGAARRFTRNGAQSVPNRRGFSVGGAIWNWLPTGRDRSAGLQNGRCGPSSDWPCAHRSSASK